MKRIALFFAAIAALSSCMKENTPAPTRPADGQVTIKAVAADTKTLLDGTAVVWEDNDVVKLVLDLDGYENDLVEDFTIANADGNEAEFTGEFGVGAMAVPAGLSAYAVYPASAVSVDNSTGKVEISHNLPAVQDGTITSGMNLSSAAVAVAGLRTGYAEAQFHNALTLLNVVVPAGVKSVALTAQTGLAGDADFTPDSKDHSENVDDPDNPGQVIEQVTPASGKLTTTGGSSATVTLSQGGEDLEGTHTLLVYPAAWGSLTLTMTGLDDAEYTNSLSTALEASKSYTIDLTKVFKMEYEETKHISPAGGTFEVAVVSTEDYTYNVNTNGASWVSLVETKAFGGKTLVFSVEANEGEAREATVTITWGEDNERTFKVVQNGVFMEIIEDENGDPIQWEETFSVYASESDALAGTGAKATYKNVFEIALSDDFSKGVYKITNMFMTAGYQNQETFQTITNKGGEYYADYADGVLTVHLKSALKSYFFTANELTLTYDAVNKTFAMAAPAAFSANYYNSDYSGKAGYVGNYSVAVKVEEEPETPGEGAGALEAFVGTWSESYEYNPGWGATTHVDGEFTVSVSEDRLFFEGMFLVPNSISYMGDQTGSYYGTLSDDGTTITLEDATSSGHGMFMQLSYHNPASIVLNVVDGTLQVSSAYTGSVMNYTASKKVEEDPLAAFVGTWSESYEYNPGWGATTHVDGEFTVSVSEDRLFFEGMFLVPNSISYMGDQTGSYYGTLSDDGTTITLEDATSSGHGMFMQLSYHNPASIVLNVVDGTLQVSSAYSGSVNDYTATKK